MHGVLQSVKCVLPEVGPALDVHEHAGGGGGDLEGHQGGVVAQLGGRNRGIKTLSIASYRTNYRIIPFLVKNVIIYVIF